jgi:phosphoglycerate dehydrogenase-like enzyme
MPCWGGSGKEARRGEARREAVARTQQVLDGRGVQILYGGTGWLPVVELIRERLAARALRAQVRVWDRQAPLTEAIREVDVLLPSNAAVDAQVIEAGTRLCLIQQPAAGTEGIDLEAAKRRGVPVANAPGANHTAVAEAALYLMLALARRANASRAAFARAEIGAVAGMELRGKKLGIVGLGRAGRALAEIARSLGMSVVATTSGSPADKWARLWSESDVISLHCPLTEATRGLVGDETLARLKPGALLINCARGPVVARGAVERALDDGTLGGLALDVFWEEPWQPDDPLFRREDVITTPHIAGSTHESLARIAEIVCDNIARASRGEAPRHRIA